MNPPTLHGIIDRRILANFRVQPEIVRKLLPPYFRPKLIHGWAMAGICLIRLKNMRPRGIAVPFGITSENAAHRIAVEWEENGVTREGVFIPRRDTSSSLQAFAGKFIFPGIHHVAQFTVNESENRFQLRMRSRDGIAAVELEACRVPRIPGTSIFNSLAEA